MATKQVELSDIGIVKLYKRRDNHSLRLSLVHDGTVKVTLPSWMPYKAGIKFVEAKRAWIISQQQELRSNFQDGQAVGKAHHLKLQRDDSITKIQTQLKSNLATVRFPVSIVSGDEAVQQAARRVSIQALRTQAEELLPKRLADLALSHGFSYKSVSVRQLKSRWGSCSQHQDITLNLFLMQLPWELIDYVLLHELVHTKVMRHGQPFWDELTKYAPNARQLRKKILVHRPAF